MKELFVLVFVQVLIARGASGECPCTHREDTDPFFPGHGEGSMVDCEFVNDGKLDVVPTQCWSLLDDVTQIFLDFNGISHIDANAFAGLPNLRSLVLSHNKISTISEGAFHGLESLEHLDLSYNKLIQPPSELWNLTSLRFLSLGKNEIIKLQDATISNLINLNTLDIHWNHLTGVPKAMLQPLSHLNKVYLHWNMLTSLPDMRANVHLTEVYVKGNALLMFPKHLFGNLTKPMTYHFSDNPAFDISASMLTPLPDFSHIKMEDDVLVWANDVEEMELILSKHWNIIDGLGNILNLKDRLMLCTRKETKDSRNRVIPC
ncbi:uncharacterized protein LOC143019618 [Oratosquilla oratoria]|uniref:uncharacterized protein LOC143019618 n=1 Tax=Oratosquilla oratoria TaxID=337810 RepID=UPI003F76B970